jgi:hypothetical protein
MRLLKILTAISFVLSIIATIKAGSPPASTEPKQSVTLMTTLEAWKYPDSQMPHGASMATAEVPPSIPSIKCQAILTTPDSFTKVVHFYNKKIGISPETNEAAKGGEPKSVTVQSDSQGRPTAIQVISVRTKHTSTTLVISRAEGEKETHIAWSHYIQLPDPGKQK